MTPLWDYGRSVAKTRDSLKFLVQDLENIYIQTKKVIPKIYLVFGHLDLNFLVAVDL